MARRRPIARVGPHRRTCGAQIRDDRCRRRSMRPSSRARLPAVARDLIGAVLTLHGVGRHRSSRPRPTTTRTPPRMPSPGRTAAQRRDVRPRRPALRLPLLRHPLVPQHRLRHGARQRRARSARWSRRSGWTRMRARRGLDAGAAALQRAGTPLPGTRRSTRSHDGMSATDGALRARCGRAAARRGRRRPAHRPHQGRRARPGASALPARVS